MRPSTRLVVGIGVLFVAGEAVAYAWCPRADGQPWVGMTTFAVLTVLQVAAILLHRNRYDAP